MNTKIKKKKGFTIIELLVAMTIFAVVISTTSISFIGSIRSQRAATKLIEANENASITIERISREIRTGTSFAETRSGKGISFYNARGDFIEYFLADDEDGGDIKRIYERLQVFGATTPDNIALTSKGVNIKELQFILTDERSGDSSRLVEKITIAMTVGLPDTTQSVKNVETNIQTTISVRPLNTPPPSDEGGDGDSQGNGDGT